MTANKILRPEDLTRQIADWQAAGEKVVFTNGCFDILHLGHVDYLEKARALGNRLVVAVNTDASVSRLKGPSRPLNPEHARARLLAALAFTDGITFFAEQTPTELIIKLRPDILVKGNDYAISEIAGAKEVLSWGGQVLTIELTEGFSTTGLIEKSRGN